jgi:hypothetical protein
MQVTNQDVRAILNDRLQRAGLLEVVERDQQQVVDMPNGFFIELLITDASKRVDVEGVVRKTQEEFQRENVNLQVLVRPLWKVGEIKYRETVLDEKEAREPAHRFSISLNAGEQSTVAFVDLTLTAVNTLREKLGKESWAGRFEWPPWSGDVTEDFLKQIVRLFAESELETRGEGYWGPSSNPVRVLNSTGVSNFLGLSTAFRDLRNAIDDAFSPEAREPFLNSLAVRSTDPKDFDQVLPELSNFFGGAYAAGGRFLTSAVDLYSRLRPAEQQLLRQYYYSVLQAAQS